MKGVRTVQVPEARKRTTVPTGPKAIALVPHRDTGRMTIVRNITMTALTGGVRVSSIVTGWITTR